MSKWLCWRPDLGETVADGDTITADNAAWAASISVRMREARQADFPVTSGETMADVSVLDEDGTITNWTVYGWAQPTYSAREKKEN